MYLLLLALFTSTQTTLVVQQQFPNCEITFASPTSSEVGLNAITAKPEPRGSEVLLKLKNCGGSLRIIYPDFTQSPGGGRAECSLRSIGDLKVVRICEANDGLKYNSLFIEENGSLKLIPSDHRDPIFSR